MRGSGIFERAIDVAKVSAELEAGRADEPEEAPSAVATPADGRLAAVLEVNRALRVALAEKRQLLAESQEEAAALQDRLVGRSLEEPLRQARIDELQGRLLAAGIPASPTAAAAATAGPRVAKEETALAREAEKLESRIEALNTENLQLADRHRDARAKAAEHQSRLRTLGKRERELARQLDHVAGELTRASSELAESRGGAEAGQRPVDYRNLPGLCLSKLLGPQLPRQGPPPAALRTSLASAQAASPAAAAASPRTARLS